MDESLREAVRERAGGGCEYCRLPEAHVDTPFQGEHVVARQHRGPTEAGNLAYACLRCNLNKGPNLTGIDPRSNKLTRLFNPRRHKWGRHLRNVGALLEARTAIGRTTVAVLAMNEPNRL